MGRRPRATATIEPAALPDVRLARDYSSSMVAQRVREEAWIRVGRGVYLAAEDLARVEVPARRRTMALARIAGTHARLPSGPCFSHQSAALVWGLPMWTVPSTTHIMLASLRGARRDRALTSHVAQPDDVDVSVVNGLVVTSLARTVADCITTRPPLEALVVADSALHRGLPRAELEAALDRCGRRNGSARARVIASLADDGPESPAESGTRFVLLRDGFPPPTTQVEVHTRIGTFWADVGFEQWRLLMEYDGRPKYDGRADEAFFREKERHNAVLETGNRLLHVVNTDLRGRRLTQRVIPYLPRSLTDHLRPRRELMT